MLVVVVVSSFVIARRRLPYEAWYAVHLTVYGALALAWFHQIPTGNELVLNQIAADYWQSLYVATIALLAYFRVLRPVFRALRHRIEVSKVVAEGPGVVSIHMTGHRLDRLGAHAGQFFLWRFLTWGRCWQSHPFSLSSAPDGRSLRITVKDLGGFTARMSEIRPGTRVLAEGPFGRFIDRARRGNRVALIAGGIGITPIRALVEKMKGDLILIYRVMSDQDTVFRGEIERLAHERGIRVFHVVGDHREPGGDKLMSPEHLRNMIPDLAERDIFTCGPPAMVRVIVRNLRNAGVPRRRLHIENFAL
jgi:predicted ferric reductase